MFIIKPSFVEAMKEEVVVDAADSEFLMVEMEQ